MHAGRLMKEGERGEGRGRKDRKDRKDGDSKQSKGGNCQFENLKNLEQIEYLVFQSTQGIHFIFDHADIIPILSKPSDDKEFFTDSNMNKVHGLLSGFLDCESLQSKRGYLDRLPAEDFELLVRAYFHLVENTILAHSNIRH